MMLCFATNNKHKLEEVKHIVGPDHKIVSLAEINCTEELPETRDTLEGNSLQKAEYIFEKFNIPCFADDTGLEVEALDGAPGVYSARYAGEHKSSDDNINLLLDKLADKSTRNARFRTIITLIGLDGKPIFFEGIIRGEIIKEKRGTSGFGYDPIFIPEGFNRTFAEMTLTEKNSLSHRAIAVKKLGAYLKNHF
ncbi:MAG: non-canonical purine NTP pyrophosphatase [Marivirga sp.]|nr:non-canonical purine NTP pyrophosphatase [Marivirga sp.]